MSKKVVEVIDDKFAAELAENGLAGFFQRAVDRDDMNVEVLTTGLPRLDDLLHKKKLGMPLSRRIEIYSKDPEVGKTSIALQIGSHWQKLGKKVAIVDIEDTITNDYLIQLNYDLDPKDPAICPPYIAKGYDESTGEVLTAEEITDKVGKVSRLVDLVIVDSLAALAKRVDLEKDLNDNTTPGGVGKVMYEHCRKYTHTKATVIWINQALPQIGVFSPMGIKYKTSGGNAVKFFSSIRLELRLVERLSKSKEEDPYGLVIDVFTAKNKVSPQDRHVKLTYLHGEGFSPTWDLFEAAMSAKVFEKKGSWISFGDQKWQGELNVYAALKSNEQFKADVQKALDDKTKIESTPS